MRFWILILALSCVPQLALAHSTYRVKHGDTLSSIALKELGPPIYGPLGSLRRLLILNPWIFKPHRVEPGRTIELEPARAKVAVVPPSARAPEALLQQVQHEVVEKKITKYRAYAVGLGYTSLAYKETARPDLNQYAPTVKLSYTPPSIAPNWDWSASSYFTAAPIISNITNLTARFLGINLRVGYSIAAIRAPWRLSLMGGWYYTTMFVSRNTLGFRHLAGPQLFPVLRRNFLNGNAAYGYLKFSPVTNGLSLTLLNLSNRELVIGFGWIHALSNGDAISTSLDAARLNLAVSNISISSTSLSLGVGYSW